MPYAIKLMNAAFPVPRLRDGRGLSAPMRVLSPDVERVFDHLPSSAGVDPNLLVRQIDAAEAQKLRQQESEWDALCKEEDERRRSAAQAKLERQMGKVKAAPVVAAPLPAPAPESVKAEESLPEPVKPQQQKRKGR